MFWLFYSFSFSLRVTDENVRLPVYSDKEGVRPYQIVKFYSQNIEFTPEDPDLIDVDIILKEYSTTVINISVKYSENKPISTKILLKMGHKKSEYPVFIDIIHHISIISPAGDLQINNLTPLHVKAFNEKDEFFTSLDGIKIEWGQSDDNQQFGIFLPTDEALKLYYDSIPSNYVIIKGVKNCISNLTCKLTNQDIDPAIYTLKFKSPVIFVPPEIYTIENAEITLNLCYSENGETPFSKVNLTDETDNSYDFESDSSDVAEVSKLGKVTTHNVHGTATITATDKNELSKPAKTVIHVIYPDGYKWDEQWIKPSEEPDIKKLTVFYHNNTVTFSKRCPIKIATNFQNIGTNNVQLIFTDLNYSVYGIVHNCPQPVPDQNLINVNVGETKYQFKIVGGSGHFDIDYDSSLINVEAVSAKENDEGKVVSTFSLSALKAGKTVIKITDQKINDYKTELDVESSESSEL